MIHLNLNAYLNEFLFQKFIFLKKTQKEWQIVFIICAIIYFVGGVVYIVFCVSEIQPWAMAKVDRDQQIKEKEAQKANQNKLEYINDAYNDSVTIDEQPPAIVKF
jgi:hypothetical protein